jgi:hypothetical protein
MGDVAAARRFSTWSPKKLWETRVKYVILIYGNPASRSVWAGFSPEQQAEGLKVYASLNADLRESGEMILSQALGDPADGRRVMVADGVAMATDGPFAEVKEHLAGFYLVDCADMDRAIVIAGRIPEAGWGMVEVRPIHTYPM